MIDLGPHTVFILGSYMGVALVVFFLVLWTTLDASRQKTRLADLEAKGFRRRSDTSPRTHMDKKN